MATLIDVKIDRKKNYLTTTRLFLPTLLGTVVEYYDYALYGFCAALLAQQFFPDNDPTLALLKTFGVFVAGSLSKPIGALIFGYIGDRAGRSVSLKISMIGIALPTVCIGIMPTYEQIGWLAPVLLLCCRIIQGIFVSGEFDGVRLFIFESVGKKYPNFANSVTNLASMMGYYLASVAASCVMHSELPNWAWRVPFVISGSMGALIFFYRFSLRESQEFETYQRSYPRKPMQSFKVVFMKNKRAILTTIFLFGAIGGGYHFYFTFLGHYLSNVFSTKPPSEIAFATSQAVLLYTLFGPVAGWMADRYGALRVFKLAGLSLFGLVLLHLWVLSQNTFPFGLMLLTAIVLPFFHAPGFVLVAEKFKVEERYRCISFGHSVGSMLFSGSAPLVGLWIWQLTQVTIAPFIYFALLILMGYMALMLNSR